MMDENICPKDCLIEPYMDNALGEKERAEFEAHLQVCASCKEQLSLAERMDDLLSEMEEEKAPVWLAERVIARARDIAPGAMPTERNWMGWMGAILVFMGFVGLLLLVVLLVTSGAGNAAPAVATASRVAGTTAAAAESHIDWMLWLSLVPVGFGAYKAAQAMGYI